MVTTVGEESRTGKGGGNRWGHQVKRDHKFKRESGVGKFNQCLLDLMTNRVMVIDLDHR